MRRVRGTESLPVDGSESSMPHDMKALVFRGDNDLRYEDWPVPSVGPADVLVRVGAVGICGSDVHGFLGKTGRRTAPMIMGHEFAGDVMRVGKRVRELRPGQQVAVFPYASCGSCACCRNCAARTRSSSRPGWTARCRPWSAGWWTCQ